MKKLMLQLVLLLLALSGCATYYYPAPHRAGETFYVVEEPARIRHSSPFAAERYYPWWSVDYFYLGNHRYGSGWSIGFGSGYDRGWYDPFYWGYDPWSYGLFDYYYSPFRYSLWYSPFHHHYDPWYARNDYYWRHRFNRHYGVRPWGGHDRGPGPGRDRYADRDWRRDRGQDHGVLDPGYGTRDSDRYAGRDRQRERDRRAGEDGPVPPAASQRHPARTGARPPMQRHVSVAPGGAPQRGTEIRSREERKPVPTRAEPIRGVARAVPAPETNVVPAPRVSVPAYASPGNRAVAVRNKLGSKDSRTRLSPVEKVPAPTPARRGVQPSSRLATRQQGPSTIRSPATGKTGLTTARPVKLRPRAVAPAHPPATSAATRPAAPALRAPSGAEPSGGPQYRSAPARSSGSPSSSGGDGGGDKKGSGSRKGGKGGKRR